MQEKDLIDFTPELNAQAREIFNQYRNGPLFTPPSVRTDTVLGTLQLPGNQGSALWQGAAWDPETNMLYVPSVSNMTVQALQPGGTRSDMTYIGGAGGGGEVAAGRTRAQVRHAQPARPAQVLLVLAAHRMPAPAGGSAGSSAVAVAEVVRRGGGGRGGGAQLPLRASFRRRSSVAAPPRSSARARAVVHGASGRRDCRSSSRRTGASPPTT